MSDKKLIQVQGLTKYYNGGAITTQGGDFHEFAKGEGGGRIRANRCGENNPRRAFKPF